MKSFKHTLYILPLLVLSACGNDQQPEDSHDTHQNSENEVILTEDQFNNASIETGKVALKRVGNTITVNGKLDVPPQQMVSVSVPIAGFVKQTSLLEGTYVKQGQVIAVLQNLDYVQIQQDYLDVKSQYEYALTEYSRQQELAKEKINAKKTLQKSKANFQSLQARYKGLESKLKLMHISPNSIQEGDISSTINVYAPINGYITKANVNVGQYVSPQDVLFRIVNTEHLHVELTVFEKDISKLEAGQMVRIKLANETNERGAIVHLIGREISSERTVLVHCHLDNEDSKLLPGMFLKAYIETDAADVHTLPESAIIKYEGRDYVFVEQKLVNDNNSHHYKMIEVTTGPTDRGYTQVSLSDIITKESHIVLNGGYSLLAKLKNTEEGGHSH